MLDIGAEDQPRRSGPLRVGQFHANIRVGKGFRFGRPAAGLYTPQQENPLCRPLGSSSTVVRLSLKGIGFELSHWHELTHLP